MIAGVRSRILSKAITSDTKRRWQLLCSTCNWSHGAYSAFESFGLALTANNLNE